MLLLCCQFLFCCNQEINIEKKNVFLIYIDTNSYLPFLLKKTKDKLSPLPIEKITPK